ncbi:MAG: FkbM family methyltransferase [Thermoplasmata archaeon]
MLKSIKWKIREHKDLVTMGISHSYILDFLKKDYRLKLYKIWQNAPKDFAKNKGFVFSDDTPAGALREIYVNNIYEHRDFVPREGDVVIDVGAYYGDSSIYWAKKYKCIVYAYEPLPDVYNIFLKNIKLNNLEDKIIAYNVALGKGDKVSFDRETNMMTKNINGDFIETKKLDDFSFPALNLLKIDTEGFELDVLQGAMSTINKFKPKIILEVHSKKLKKDCINVLKSLGYNKIIYGRKEKNDKMDLVQNLFMSIK